MAATDQAIVNLPPGAMSNGPAISNLPIIGGGGSVNPLAGGGSGPMGDWSSSWGNFVAPATGNGPNNGFAGGENENTVSTGFSFTPPPLVLNGQSVAGGLNFTASLPVAQVDQASQAYAFTSSLTGDAYGFLSSAINSAMNSAAATFQPIISNEQILGTGELSALQTEANALQTAAGKLGGGGGGLLGALGL
jgi:hypothetical protein